MVFYHPGSFAHRGAGRVRLGLGQPHATRDGGPLQGFDSLLSTVQMPKGVPVATVAIGSAGAVNSAILAAQMISLSSPEVEQSLKKQREDSVKSIEQINKDL